MKCPKCRTDELLLGVVREMFPEFALGAYLDLSLAKKFSLKTAGSRRPRAISSSIL